jgi:ribosome-associated toxin RatA of RatAB toxin-antitoxin module
MKRNPFLHSLGSGRWILAVILAALGIQARAGEAPAPRDQLPQDEAGIAKMMKVTWSQEVLPVGAKAETLRELLQRGEVILINDHPPASPWLSAAGILVDAPPEVVFGVFTDFAKFPEYVPMCEKAAPTLLAPNWVDVEFTVSIKLAIVSYDITYSCYHYNRSALFRTDWCKHAGEFSVNSGFYQALPADGGRRTMLFYSVYSVPNSSFVRSIYAREPTLEMMTSVSTATMMVRALKKRAEEVYRQSPGYVPLPPRPAAPPIQEILLGDPQTLKLLAEQGKILVLEDGPTVYVTAGTVVKAPPDKAFDLVARFEDAPRYIPGVRRVEPRGQGAKGPRYFWSVEMNLAFLTYRYEYTLDYELDRPDQIRWMIPREAGDAPGFWRFIPLEGGRSCLIFNGATADVRAMGWIPRYALKVEPTLEHALIGSQGAIAINASKDHIQSLTASK